MKRLFALICAVAFALVLAGCAQGGSSQASASGTPDASGTASAASASSAAASSASAQAGIANPWTGASSADEAAKDAGLESFATPEDPGIGDFKFEEPQYSSMEGIAQAVYDAGAADLTVRKGEGVSGVDFHGDWTDYPEHWTQDCDGVEVECSGYAPGLASLIEWHVGDDAYSVMFRGLGGDELGLSSVQVAEFVASVS